ncbi:MAG TPA: calcium-binding protein, partial [Paracoccaceae bacterium]|nr:calcium-binding protein [Paracoccaceae bacterium]
SSVGGGLYYTNLEGSGPQTYMIADIEALQFMYGANFDANAGDTVYSFSTSTGEMFVNGVGQGAASDNIVFRTVWDGGGTDLYDFSNYATDLSIDLTPGGYADLDAGGEAQRARLSGGAHARGHVFNAAQYRGDARSLIENARGGAGDDGIGGNRADNWLAGNGGNDRLEGGAGADRLEGGRGADRLEGGGQADRLSGGAGADRLAGGAGNDRLAGGEGDDELFGGGGDDRLAGGAGTDRLAGGPGDDRLVGGSGEDLLTGGTGADLFAIGIGGGQTGIADFHLGEDMIDLTALGLGGPEALIFTALGSHLEILGPGLSLWLVDFAAGDAPEGMFLF